jgi:predicted anti-sigma-YlaC factor YlaD
MASRTQGEIVQMVDPLFFVSDRSRARDAAGRLGMLGVLCLALLAPGCSVKKMAIKMVASSLSEGSSSFATDDDPELIKDALPFGLKTMEGMLAQLPKDRLLLRSVAVGFTSYSAGFIQPDIRGLEDIDLDRAREQKVRARRMFIRARDYGLRALEVSYPRLREKLMKDPKAALAKTVKADVPDLYWTAAAWGSAISLGKDQMDLVADLPIVDALIHRALELDKTWEAGSLDEFMIAFESRGEAQGGSLDRARGYFNEAMSLARGKRISPLVSLAENVSITTQNRAEFDRLLDEALAFDCDKYPETRLANLLAQKHARQLKALAGSLFLEEK